MKETNVKKMAFAGILCALAIVGSLFSFPFLGSKCAPVQHLVNVLAAVTLGPAYSLGVAFAASLIRNMLSIGSLMAFPGSMFGALLSAVAYKKFKSIPSAVLGELLGTSILGGLCAYPVAVLLMGKDASKIAFYAYVVPFFISTSVGALIAGFVLYLLKVNGSLKYINNSNEVLKK